MSTSRNLYGFSHVPSGTAHLHLLAWAGSVASTVAIRWSEACEGSPPSREILDAFRAVGARSDDAPDDDDAQGVRRIVAPLTEEILSAVGRVSHALSDWRLPHLPEDIEFVRADGSVLLASVCAGELIWLEADDDELQTMVPVLRESLGLRPVSVQLDHPEAVWGDRADTVVRAAVTAPGLGDERLRCREIEGGLFEVCCIPFRAAGLALGDIVRARRLGRGGEWMLVEVAERRGHGVAWVSVDGRAEALASICDVLVRDGVLFEAEGENGLAVDIVPGDAGDRVWAFLQDLEEQDGVHLAYSA